MSALILNVDLVSEHWIEGLMTRAGIESRVARKEADCLALINDKPFGLCFIGRNVKRTNIALACHYAELARNKAPKCRIAFVLVGVDPDTLAFARNLQNTAVIDQLDPHWHLNLRDLVDTVVWTAK